MSDLRDQMRSAYDKCNPGDLSLTFNTFTGELKLSWTTANGDHHNWDTVFSGTTAWDQPNRVAEALEFGRRYMCAEIICWTKRKT